jgi:hypothetical protein
MDALTTTNTQDTTTCPADCERGVPPPPCGTGNPYWDCARTPGGMPPGVRGATSGLRFCTASEHCSPCVGERGRMGACVVPPLHTVGYCEPCGR